MLVSTFELLVKRQLPATIIDENGTVIDLITSPLSRGIVQGYFLTLANTSDRDASLVLTFDSASAIDPILGLPATLPDVTVTFLDINGMTNDIGDLIPDSNTAYKFAFNVAANTTALFLLQPDIINTDALTALNIELRGYVNIALTSPTGGTPIQFMITPEHRGTFFNPDAISSKLPLAERQLGEIAYALPTASGGSLFELS